MYACVVMTLMSNWWMDGWMDQLSCESPLRGGLNPSKERLVGSLAVALRWLLLARCSSHGDVSRLLGSSNVCSRQIRIALHIHWAVEAATRVPSGLEWVVHIATRGEGILIEAKIVVSGSIISQLTIWYLTSDEVRVPLGSIILTVRSLEVIVHLASLLLFNQREVVSL